MSRDRLPLLFISVEDVLSEEAKLAIAQAWELGWLPIAPPLETFLGAATWEESEKLGIQAINTLLWACDAFLLVGKPTDRMRRELNEFSFHNTSPIYATIPEASFPERPRLGSPPWHAWPDAAEKKTVEGWACKTCRRWWGADERMARWCCATDLPCDRCGKLKPKKDPWIYCGTCRGTVELERWEKKKQAPWNGHMLYSEAEEEWFQDLDAAIDQAVWRIQDREHGSGREPMPSEIREELDNMRVVLSEPVTGRHVEVFELLSDDLPEDSDSYSLSSAVEDAEEALNKAIDDMGPISWSPTNVRLDVATVDLERKPVSEREET